MRETAGRKVRLQKSGRWVILLRRSTMYRKSILLLTTLAVLVLGGGFMAGQDKAAKDSRRESDKQAIDQLTREAIRAFDERDAAAITAHWTADGEFIRNDGEPIRGRAE